MQACPEQWLQRQLGQSVQSRQPVAGGCIHGAWRLVLADGRALFLKTNRASALPLLQAEASGLRALAAVAPDDLQVPMPLAVGRAGDQALLLLPWLDLTAAGDSRAWQQLGRSLARLHRASLANGPGQGRVGWDHDNWIGATPQPNGWWPRWGAFFCQQRLGHQLRLAAVKGQPYRNSEALLALALERLEHHSCQAVLVHGDLWSGNAALVSGGAGALFDPAVYRGDREVDLAMARLFGGFPEAFFAGYEAGWPLPADTQSRVELYNLYHLLNHALMFGGGYRHRAQDCIDRLLSPGIPAAGSGSG
jgi:fructosamine-3-kinase